MKSFKIVMPNNISHKTLLKNTKGADPRFVYKAASCGIMLFLIVTKEGLLCPTGEKELWHAIINVRI